MGPVRVGNQAAEHFQHDVYGNVVLGAAQAFHDHRLLHRAGLAEFKRLEQVGDYAVRVYGQPDAGMWELRTRARVHTSSALMSWAALRPAGQDRRHAATGRPCQPLAATMPTACAPRFSTSRGAKNARRLPRVLAGTSWTPACC